MLCSLQTKAIKNSTAAVFHLFKGYDLWPMEWEEEAVEGCIFLPAANTDLLQRGTNVQNSATCILNTKIEIEKPLRGA